MIPFWVYTELPAAFLVGIITNIVFCWQAKTIIVFGLGLWWLGTLVDYFVIAPMFHIPYYFNTLCIGMGLCALCAWMGWFIVHKLEKAGGKNVG